MTDKILPPQQIREIELYQKNMGVDFQTIPCNTEDEIIAAARYADAVITLMQPYSRRVIENLQNCKLIFNAGTGFNTIDLKAATEFGICVTYPGDYCTEEVSEHAMALLLAYARKIIRIDRAVKEGKWDSFEKREIRGKILPPIFRIKGQTLGIIGLGRSGRATVPKAKGFGMKVIAFDPIQIAIIVNKRCYTGSTLRVNGKNRSGLQILLPLFWIGDRAEKFANASFAVH